VNLTLAEAGGYSCCNKKLNMVKISDGKPLYFSNYRNPNVCNGSLYTYF